MTDHIADSRKAARARGRLVGSIMATLFFDHDGGLDLDCRCGFISFLKEIQSKSHAPSWGWGNFVLLGYEDRMTVEQVRWCRDWTRARCADHD